jgi:4,5-dihydroxyphthalate decarboxylase
MANAELNLCVMPSVLTRPLLEGEVAPTGVTLRAQPAESIDTLTRRMLGLEYDVGEMAVATFLKAREQGVPLVALPLFTSGRRFVHAGLLLSRRAGIRDPAELPGKRAGTPQYWISWTIWQRQILRQMHGVAADTLSWVTTQPERMDALRTPPGVTARRDTTGRSPLELMEADEIEVSFSSSGPSGPAAAQGGAAVPAYPDRAAAHREYYERTGIFPIMHLTVMKADLAASQPSLVESLCDAYARAKQLARARERPTAAAAPAAGETTIELQQLMGDDPWPYGIEPNRRTLDALLEAARDQGLLDRPVAVDELFPADLSERYR